MTYPEIIRAELDQAVALALQNSTAAKYSSRTRKVTQTDIIKALIFMEGGSLQKELHEARLPITSSAFIQRRHQIPSMLFEDILTAFNSLHQDRKTYQGYRVVAIDGTAVNMARDPASRCFVLHAGAPQGYCQIHANPLYDVLNKTYYDCVVQPQPEADEIKALNYVLSWHVFEEKTLIVADRAYASYNVFATIQNTPNVDFLIRVKQGSQEALQTLNYQDVLYEFPSVLSIGKTSLVLKTPKTASSIWEVYLPETLMTILYEFYQSRKRVNTLAVFPDLIFCYEDGRPIQETTLTKHFHIALERAGLPRVPFHSLRHPNVKPKTKIFFAF